MILTDSLIADTLRVYGVGASPALCDGIRTYVELLLRWNHKIALTTITDPQEILRLHFGESMFAVNEVPIRHGRLADVGTGAGFPAIPISMAAPKIACVLIESNQKKATFLAEVIRALKLDRIEVFRGRMEDYPASKTQFDFTVCRALGMHNSFLKWSAKQLAPGGKVVYWVGDEDAAKISADQAWSWQNPSRIPESQHRALLIGELRTLDHPNVPRGTPNNVPRETK
jgi:16S rRNA (guanine527-N7)-methyltransferase